MPSATCQVYQHCGGCSFWPEDRTAEFAAVCQSFLGVLNLPSIPNALSLANHLHPSRLSTGFRRKTQLRLRIEGGRLLLGYFRPGQRDLVAIRNCPICVPLIDAAIHAIHGAQVDIADLRTRIELVAVESGLAALLLEDAWNPNLKRLADFLHKNCPALHWLDIRGETGNFPLQQVATVGSVPLYWHPGTFLQSHEVMNATLRTVIGTYLSHGDRVVDLYAGNGNLSLPFAEVLQELVLVEEVRAGGVASLKTIAEMGWSHVKVLHQSAESFVSTADLEDSIVIVDPPRAGIGALASSLMAKPWKRLCMVHCGRDAALHDIKRMAQTKSLEDLHCFDMFPNTADGLEILSVWGQGTA